MRARTIYLVANALGLILYAAFAVRVHLQIRAEHRDSDFGDSLNFALTAFPVLITFFAVNLSWGSWALVRLLRHRQHEPILACGSALAMWVITVVAARQLS